MTLGYSNIEVINLNTLDDGYRFSFIGCEDLPNIPSALLGGQIGGTFQQYQVVVGGQVCQRILYPLQEHMTLEMG